MSEKKRGKNSFWIIAIIVIAVVAILIYFLIGGNNSTINQPNDSPGCNLEQPFDVELPAGSSIFVSVEGYQGTLDQVSWRSENSAVAEVNPKSGEDIFLEGKSPGTTRIIIVDNSIGFTCFVAMNVVVN